MNNENIVSDEFLLDSNILSYLESKGVGAIHVLEQYKKGGIVEYFDNTNIILSYRDRNINVFTCDIEKNKSLMEIMIKKFLKVYNSDKFKNSEFLTCVITEEVLADKISDLISSADSAKLYNAMYEDTIKIPQNSNEDIEFRDLTMDDSEIVFNNYTHAGDDSKYTDSRIMSGEMIGAYYRGNLAGFIGTHEDGTMGMLEVFKEYRKHGIGKLLVFQLIKRQREKNRTAYGNIETWNEIAYGMYDRMGFTIDKNVTTWLFK